MDSTAPRPVDYEARLPEGQRWLNRTCENWIFAFLVAMAIRHFVIEAFRIPTGSMEPMLYGDPGFLKGDHVVVDKFFVRFTGVDRWDVTVFQFPQPEIEGSNNDARPAVAADGKRLDKPLIKPLMYRNFVKRCVILPGDTFFIANGNVYLKQGDGFQVARKPPKVQEALWHEVYRSGAQAGHLPWNGSGGSTVAARDGSAIDLTLVPGGSVAFTQPFRNLYVKPGAVRVKRLPSTDDGMVVDVAMTRPQFTYDRGVIGNIWDLDHWEVQRLTSADLDNGGYGTQLNHYQKEWVGDVRITARIAALTGACDLILRHGRKLGGRLHVTQNGWSLHGTDELASEKPLAQGADQLVGHAVSIIHLDDRLVVAVDGMEKAQVDVPQVDPNRLRTEFAVEGEGSLSLAEVTVERDIHYTSSWVLTNAVDERRSFEAKLASDRLSSEERDKQQSRLDDIGRIRLQFKANDDVSAWGCSPETAVTAPKGAYLMLGDNSPTSWDGRAWGWVPEVNLRGHAIAVVLPPNRWRVVK
ncbi:MAG: signal peptidase I [Planctomycetes bacterium]|nr:signal peptidase I [Planctomycetota bacterium]